jgi:hypothetical protein
MPLQSDTRPCVVCGTPVTRVITGHNVRGEWTCSRSCSRKKWYRGRTPDVKRRTPRAAPAVAELTDKGACPLCDRPYGARKRCYYCQPAKQKTGETRACKICGKDFYAAKWQLDDTVNNQGVYCSRACKHKGMEIDGPGSRRRRGDGYIEVFYPKHPDAPRSGWMLEHRLIAEQKYGRRLTRMEQVHHINSVKNDNRPENLEIIDASTHSGISNKRGADLRRAMRTELEQMRAELAEYRRRFGPLEKE